MIRTTDELSTLLRGTSREGHQVIPLDVPKDEDQALAVEVDGRELIDAWKVCRGLLDETGRWPVATLSWFGSGDWAASLVDEQLLARHHASILRRASSSDARRCADPGLAARDLRRVYDHSGGCPVVTPRARAGREGRLVPARASLSASGCSASGLFRCEPEDSPIPAHPA